MKTFNASDMTNNRAAILEAAREEGVIIQRKNTNGVVLEEFVMLLGDRDDDGNISFGNGGLVMSEDIE